VEREGVRAVERCDCRVTERSERLLDQARIPRRYEHCSFENFDIRKDKVTGQPNASLARGLFFARRFVEEYPAEFGLLFYGTTGVGKTHLAVAVLRELALEKGVACLFYDFRDLLKEIRDSYNPVSETSELRVLQPVLDAEVLLLDEMAASDPSTWVKETLAHIINSRYNQKRTTLITTTLPMGEATGAEKRKMPSGEPIDVDRSLGQFGATMVSRLYEMCQLVRMDADDYRRAIKQSERRGKSK
jgi:DNA replication protein DnaC